MIICVFILSRINVCLNQSARVFIQSLSWKVNQLWHAIAQWSVAVMAAILNLPSVALPTSLQVDWIIASRCQQCTIIYCTPHTYTLTWELPAFKGSVQCKLIKTTCSLQVSHIINCAELLPCCKKSIPPPAQPQFKTKIKVISKEAVVEESYVRPKLRFHTV